MSVFLLQTFVILCFASSVHGSNPPKFQLDLNRESRYLNLFLCQKLFLSDGNHPLQSGQTKHVKNEKNESSKSEFAHIFE